MIIMLLPLLGSQVPRDRTSGISDFARSFEQFALCSWKIILGLGFRVECRSEVRLCHVCHCCPELRQLAWFGDIWCCLDAICHSSEACRERQFQADFAVFSMLSLVRYDKCSGERWRRETARAGYTILRPVLRYPSHLWNFGPTGRVRPGHAGWGRLALLAAPRFIQLNWQLVATENWGRCQQQLGTGDSYVIRICGILINARSH